MSVINPALDQLLEDARDAIEGAQSLASLEQLRVGYLGKKGVITEQLKSIGSLPPEQRKDFGAGVNRIKVSIADLLEARQQDLAEQAIAVQKEQSTRKKLDTAISFGTAILGAVLGRKKLSSSTATKMGSAIRTAGSASKEAADVARAEALGELQEA